LKGRERRASGARLLIVDLPLVVDVAVALRSLGDAAAVDVAIGV
jgi:hypothetical protein